MKRETRSTPAEVREPDVKDEPRTKRPWTRPQLGVVVRSKPEEAVLVGCKTGTMVIVGPTNDYYSCQVSPGAGCIYCSAIAPS